MREQSFGSNDASAKKRAEKNPSSMESEDTPPSLPSTTLTLIEMENVEEPDLNEIAVKPLEETVLEKINPCEGDSINSSTAIQSSNLIENEKENEKEKVKETEVDHMEKEEMKEAEIQTSENLIINQEKEKKEKEKNEKDEIQIINIDSDSEEEELSSQTSSQYNSSDSITNHPISTNKNNVSNISNISKPNDHSIEYSEISSDSSEEEEEEDSESEDCYSDEYNDNELLRIEYPTTLTGTQLMKLIKSRKNHYEEIEDDDENYDSDGDDSDNDDCYLIERPEDFLPIKSRKKNLSKAEKIINEDIQYISDDDSECILISDDEGEVENQTYLINISHPKNNKNSNNYKNIFNKRNDNTTTGTTTIFQFSQQEAELFNSSLQSHVGVKHYYQKPKTKKRKKKNNPNINNISQEDEILLGDLVSIEKLKLIEQIKKRKLQNQSDNLNNNNQEPRKKKFKKSSSTLPNNDKFKKRLHNSRPASEIPLTHSFLSFTDLTEYEKDENGNDINIREEEEVDWRNPNGKYFQDASSFGQKIPSSNIGYKLLKQAGWNGSSGLGKNNQGISAPIIPKSMPGRRGLD